MMFSRQHYEEIARLLAAHYSGDTRHDAVVDEIVEDFTAMFKFDNPKFSEARFIRAVEGS